MFTRTCSDTKPTRRHGGRLRRIQHVSSALDSNAPFSPPFAMASCKWAAVPIPTSTLRKAHCVPWPSRGLQRLVRNTNPRCLGGKLGQSRPAVVSDTKGHRPLVTLHANLSAWLCEHQGVRKCTEPESRCFPPLRSCFHRPSTDVPRPRSVHWLEVRMKLGRYLLLKTSLYVLRISQVSQR